MPSRESPANGGCTPQHRRLRLVPNAGFPAAKLPVRFHLVVRSQVSNPVGATQLCLLMFNACARRLPRCSTYGPRAEYLEPRTRNPIWVARIRLTRIREQTAAAPLRVLTNDLPHETFLFSSRRAARRAPWRPTRAVPLTPSPPDRARSSQPAEISRLYHRHQGERAHG